MKIIMILLAGYALVSILDGVALSNETEWYTSTPYERCLQSFEGSSRIVECRELKSN